MTVIISLRHITTAAGFYQRGQSLKAVLQPYFSSSERKFYKTDEGRTSESGRFSTSTHRRIKMGTVGSIRHSQDLPSYTCRPTPGTLATEERRRR